MSVDVSALLTAITAQRRAQPQAGRVADYIPALARVPATQFAIAAQTLEGECHAAGDSGTRFSIQSISKLFLLAHVLPRRGDALWNDVGREPSGNRFNSLVQLEVEDGKPRNPFINAGALVLVDQLLALSATPLADLLQFIREEAADDSISIDDEVAASEREHIDRNAALVHFMRSFGRIRHRVDDVLDLYCQTCAIAMNVTQLARAVCFLAQHGHSPISGRTRMTRSEAKRINALMLTCGTYDAAGEFAYRVGLPCKSGVGGGIVAVIPNRMGLCVWSPALAASGNSANGLEALDAFTTATGWSVF